MEEDTIYFNFLLEYLVHVLKQTLVILFVVLPVNVVYTKVLPLLHVKRVKLLERDKNVHNKTLVINL